MGAIKNILKIRIKNRMNFIIALPNIAMMIFHVMDDIFPLYLSGFVMRKLSVKVPLLQPVGFCPLSLIEV
jgi:hypothetical protein